VYGGRCVVTNLNSITTEAAPARPADGPGRPSSPRVEAMLGLQRRWATVQRAVEAQARARTAAIDKLAPAANGLVILAMPIEQRTAHKLEWFGFTEELNRKSFFGLPVIEFGNAASDTDAGLRARASTGIAHTAVYAAARPVASVSGLRGESALGE